MRKIESTSFSGHECLRRALGYEWLSENCSTTEVAAYYFDQARLWRSFALVAREDVASSDNKHPHSEPTSPRDERNLVSTKSDIR
jgi:hypothetical protein